MAEAARRRAGRRLVSAGQRRTATRSCGDSGGGRGSHLVPAGRGWKQALRWPVREEDGGSARDEAASLRAWGVQAEQGGNELGVADAAWVARRWMQTALVTGEEDGVIGLKTRRRWVGPG